LQVNYFFNTFTASLGQEEKKMGEKPKPLENLKIEIGGAGSAKYKSIENIVWENIPPFVVLTGLNGSGKTQLIELLAYRLSNARHPQNGDLSAVHVKVTGDSFGPDSVAFLPNQWTISSSQALGIGELQQVKRQLFQQLQHEHQIQGNLGLTIKKARLETILGVKLNTLDVESFIKRVPDDFSFMLEESNIAEGLTHVFLAYRLRVAEQLERETPMSEIIKNLGPAPWDVLNDTFKAAEFPYRVKSPKSSGLLDVYQLRLHDESSGNEINPVDLSSGELRLLGLVLWLYNSKHHGRFPRLFLMDEPDAHLHPSMARHFINVVKEVLVDRYKVRVILSTHSPSTVALAPDGSIFEMSKNSPRIIPSKSKAATIGLLTAGLVIVTPSTRFVFVEDEDDTLFFSSIRDVLTDYGPSKDPRCLKPSPSIVFLPASIGKGPLKTSGGKTVVVKWIEKFDQPPLDQLFRGIIDRDINNSSTPRILVLGRYSIENYLLDPFVIFALLLEQGTAPVIPGVSVSTGDEHLVRSLSKTQLQAILEGIRRIVEPTLQNLLPTETALQSVMFTNGVAIEYPVWMLNRRGHDLLPIYQSIGGGAGVVSPPRLNKSLRRVRLIPVELVEILETIQS
jgi:energy-coupling factor transporter ATP-binding protein EcfA2